MYFIYPTACIGSIFLPTLFRYQWKAQGVNRSSEALYLLRALCSWCAEVGADDLLGQLGKCFRVLVFIWLGYFSPRK